MKIGIDLDEVTAEFVEALLIFYNNRTGKELKKSDITSYNLWEVWGGNRKEAIDIVEEFHKTKSFDNIEPSKEAVNSIKKLVDKNEIFIITSRPQHHRNKTEKWFKRHFGEHTFKIIFSGDFHNNGKKKSEICINLAIKCILEDNSEYALDCASKGIPVLLFDKPWNQNISHENIIRVKNWEEAMKEISIIQNNNI